MGINLLDIDTVICSSVISITPLAYYEYHNTQVRLSSFFNPSFAHFTEHISLNQYSYQDTGWMNGQSELHCSND